MTAFKDQMVKQFPEYHLNINANDSVRSSVIKVQLSALTAVMLIPKKQTGSSDATSRTSDVWKFAVSEMDTLMQKYFFPNDIYSKYLDVHFESVLTKKPQKNDTLWELVSHL